MSGRKSRQEELLLRLASHNLRIFSTPLHPAFPDCFSPKSEWDYTRATGHFLSSSQQSHQARLVAFPKFQLIIVLSPSWAKFWSKIWFNCRPPLMVTLPQTDRRFARSPSRSPRKWPNWWSTAKRCLSVAELSIARSGLQISETARWRWTRSMRTEPKSWWSRDIELHFNGAIGNTYLGFIRK